jgi:hypothetical protein
VGYKGGILFNNMAGTWKEIVAKVGPDAIEGAVGGFKNPKEYRKERWVLELCDAYEKKYGVWETDAVNWITGWFAFMAAVKKAKFDALDYKRRFVPRPDRKNPRTCDSVGEQVPGVVKNGRFQVIKLMSIDENYKKTVEAFGLQKVYGLQ